MASLAKKDKYAILWLNSQGKSTEEISKDLGFSIKQVAAIVTKNSSEIKTTSGPVKKYPSKELMITESASKKNRVAIMTKESSAINDEQRKKNQAKSPKLEKGIFRPNGR
jgi:hypothetical protein